jgi:hypothetical protein
MIDLDQPVIWTTKGNVNESDVEKFSDWEFPNDGTIVHVVGCRDKVTGEVIKRAVYVFTTGINAGAEAGTFQ